MIKWRSIWLIFLRETRDQLRDRRMLFLLIVLPVLLYPALALTMAQLLMQRVESARHVVVLGADDLPDEPALIDNEYFSELWFRRPSDPEGKDSPAAAKRLIVVSDKSPLPESGTPIPGTTLNTLRLLEDARRFVAQTEKFPSEAAAFFSKSGLQAVIVVPPGFRDQLQKIREHLARDDNREAILADYEHPQLYYNQADEKSLVAYERVNGALDKWEKAIVAKWLELSRLDPRLMTPIKPKPMNIALPEQVGASVWSKVLPLLLIMMTAVGAFNPSVDLVAGEKERGTMETLLICPATRTEIVLGKFFTVMCFSVVTALLNLGSLGLTGRQIAGQLSSVGNSQLSQMSFPSIASLGWVLLVLIPLAWLFSALSLALATFARSSKEGQYYLTPLLMATIGLTMFCLFPNVELSPSYSVLPIVGPSLLLKSLLQAQGQNNPATVYIVPVLIMSSGYAALALSWAIDQFQRESILYRADERFELGLWLRKVLREKLPYPSYGEAWACFLAILFLQFFAAEYLPRLAGLDKTANPSDMLKLLLLQQVTLMAAPAILMGMLLTNNLRETFRLRWPDGKTLIVAAILPFLLHPVAIEVQVSLQWFFGELPESMVEMFKPLGDDSLPLWLVLLTIAGAPAICEELAFRGFILSGLASQGRVSLAILFSSAAFGIIHMIPQQVFNAGLLGLVIAGLALRSRSLLPCVVFHFINNALSVGHGRLRGDSEESWYTLFAAFDNNVLRYKWPTLVLCLMILVPLLVWLYRPLSRAARVSRQPSPAS
jgi:sodium transport system permease protein